MLSLTAYYIQACPKDEEVINECLRDSGNRLTHYLRQGIPELDIFEVGFMGFVSGLSTTHMLFQIEPVLIDEIGIVLGNGPDGYRAQFRNIEAFGVSNVTVTNVR